MSICFDSFASNMKYIGIETYKYELPNEKIAKFPLENRNDSQLLVYQNQKINHQSFQNIIDYINTNDLLVFNNSKVIPARLHIKKNTGANIEIFLLEPKDISHEKALSATQEVTWISLVGNLKKWKENEILSFEITLDNQSKTEVFCTKKTNENLQIEVTFHWENQYLNFAQIIEKIGSTPIPPYLERDATLADKERYQTVYANKKGSVAAPTAGLHFTNEIIFKLKEKNVAIAETTLHVGAGTFLPVKVDNVLEHPMHFETILISKELIKKILFCKGNIIATGTTSLRNLESIYWLAHQYITTGKFLDTLSKEYAWNATNEISLDEALNSLLAYFETNNLDTFFCHTQLFILPFVPIKVVDVLITNFHQPSSTLLMLVDSFTKGNWKEIYEAALANNYRFLSYGDSSILFRK